MEQQLAQLEQLAGNLQPTINQNPVQTLAVVQTSALDNSTNPTLQRLNHRTIP